jgi:large subunit ribosomal protein L30
MKKEGTKSQAIKVKQVRSAAGRDKRTLLTLNALGLGRIGDVQELPANAAIKGMLRKVEHLVELS